MPYSVCVDVSAAGNCQCETAWTMHFCAPTAGQYHFQTKVASGKGEYRTGVFVAK